MCDGDDGDANCVMLKNQVSWVSNTIFNLKSMGVWVRLQAVVNALAYGYVILPSFYCCHWLPSR